MKGIARDFAAQHRRTIYIDTCVLTWVHDLNISFVVMGESVEFIEV